MDELTAVFHVTAPIEEIGAREGDRLVIRPRAIRPALLQRTVEPRWAFDPRCEMAFTRPHLPREHALRRLRDHLPRQRRPGHLRLV